jgi:DNA-binding MarR family transcriptional regulator
MPNPLEYVYRRPGFLLKRCDQVTAALFVEHCSGFKVTPSQYGALCALREFPGTDQLAVGRLVGLDRSTAGLVIKLLAARGLVEREVNARDARRMHLRLSAAGKRLLERMAPAARRAQEAALAVLPRGKRAQFLELLQKFLAGHDAVIEPAGVTAGKPFGSRFDALLDSRPGPARNRRARRVAGTRSPRNGTRRPRPRLR